MDITFNGEPYLLPSHCHTLLDVLQHANIEPKGRIIEHNGTIIKHHFHDVPIHNQDTIEVIQFMGGG